jgi:hypothetical protein
VLTASILRAMIMEAGSRLHGAISQNTVIFILAAVRTWNLISY